MSPRRVITAVAYAVRAGSVPTDIADNAIGAAQIADHVRTLSFPASALAEDPDSDVITRYEEGLVWQQSYTEVPVEVVPAAGVYFYRIQAGGFVFSRKMTLLK